MVNKMKMDFDELFNLYSKKVYNLAFRITGSKEDSENIVQDTFLQIYRSLDDFREESTIYTWIYKIALNNCLQTKKKNSKVILLPHEELINARGASITSQSDKWFSHPEDSSITAELLREIRQFCYQFIVFELPGNQRIAYILRHILELSYKDIAEILGTSGSIVKARLHRAKSNLVRLIEEKKPTCRWYNEKTDLCCKRKLEHILEIDQELLNRTKQQAYETGLISQDEIKSTASRSIEELFEHFPMLSHKIDINSIKNLKII